MTTTRPESSNAKLNALPRPEGELQALQRAWESPKGWRKLSAVNNTHIGVFYIVTALVFFVLAGALALLMRLQLAVPDNDLISAGTYNQLFTMHGTVMMFLFAVPIVEAVAVYLLPNMLGARDLPFPRLSAYAFWAYAIGGLAFFCTIFFGASPDGGWFMYPPLTGKEHSPGIGADWWLLGIGFIEISAIAGAIELIVGILFTRAPGMTLRKMPVFAWAMLVSAAMIVFAFPAIIAGTILLELERALDWPFFIAARGGDPLLWQHLFWFFGHPEVYIIFLPAAGLVSMMVPTLAQTRLVGHMAVVWALGVVGVISFLLWVHHMFTAGLGNFAMYLASIASFAVSIPSAIQVFAWIATFWKGKVQFAAPTLFLLGFHLTFVIGGLTGVMLAVIPFDWQVHDTYFIVAHLHYVLIGGMMFPIFAALYYWAPVFNGHRMSERVSKWTFGLIFGGFNLAFFPMHISGLLGMPRRVYTYADASGLNTLNMLSTIGAFIFAAGALLCLGDALRTFLKSDKQHGNPWNAGTLEWLPSEEYNIRSIPDVDSLEPLWADASLAQKVEQGRYWLPGSIFGGRETLVTSPVNAEVMHLLRLPGDGSLPFIAAAGTAGFFLLLTVSMFVTAAIFGVISIVAMIAWLWASDRAPAARLAEVKDGQFVPTTAWGTRSHSWWAMIVLICVDASIFASLAFSHVHVSMALDICPPPGAALPARDSAWWSILLLVAGSIAVHVSCKLLAAKRHAWIRLAIAVAMVCVVASFSIDLLSQIDARLSPRADAWSATIAAMLGWQGFHVLVLIIMGSYVIARSFAGHLQADARATLDNTAVMWHYVSLQGLAAILLVQYLPKLMN